MVNELRAVVEELGGEQTLGRTLSSDRDMREAIREGFPPAVVEELMRASGLTLKELASALDLSPRSLQRRRRSGRLARYESDRLYRLARIVAIANEYLGDHERAMRWLKHPNRALGGLAPIAAIDTELGARQVESILGASPTAELVEPTLSSLAQDVRPYSLSRRRSIPLRWTVVESRNPPQLCLGTSISRHAGVFRPS